MIALPVLGVLVDDLSMMQVGPACGLMIGAYEGLGRILD